MNSREIVNLFLCIVLAVIVGMLAQEALGYNTILCDVSDICMMGTKGMGSVVVAMAIMLPIIIWGLYESSARIIPARS